MDFSINNDSTAMSWLMKSKMEYTQDWFMSGSPFLPVLIVAAYLVFILKLGPALMENRKPFILKTPLLIYNTIQVLLSAYAFYRGSELIFNYGLFSSDKCWFETDLNAERNIMAAIHLYYILKVTELTDTVFFVLRKKKNQITFLHWYHHVLMMLSTFITTKYMPTYAVVFLGTINSFVHIVMYSYYGLSAYPQLEKYLWWKKYITSFQLIQFVLIIIHVLTYTYLSKCSTPTFILSDILVNAFFLIYLFGDFYVKSYVKKNADHDVSKINVKHESSVVTSIKGISRQYITS